MVLIGLLLVALVCLALGLVLASAGWLVASLAATAAAAYFMWAKRDEVLARPQPSAPTDHDDTNALDADYLQRRADWFAEGTAKGDVWVVDGQANYHAAGCRLLIGEAAEPIPFAQATEDGFRPCPVCDPDTTLSPPIAHTPAPVEPVAAPERSATDSEVWVVDGQPDYHLAGCTRLIGESVEPVPFGQATDDGFTPCPLCYPAQDATVVLPATSADASAQPAAAVGPADANANGHSGEVWVVDGRPRYHRSECMIIKGQDAEPVPFDQATEDGFMPCSLCEPNALSR
jgi:hypothetical protein